MVSCWAVAYQENRERERILGYVRVPSIYRRLPLQKAGVWGVTVGEKDRCSSGPHGPWL